MQKPEIPKNETLRLRELDSYDLFEYVEVEDFDFLTSMAAEICGTKISQISLITKDKQRFLSSYGLETSESSRDYSFCAHAINNPKKLFLVEDARKDPRFFDNPLTTGYPHVIFYAGIPLVTSNGFPLGSLCVVDDKPGKLNEEQMQKLKQLAKQTVKLFELRRKQIELKKSNEEIEQLSFIAAHDLKEPLRGISTYLSILKKKYGEQLEEKGNQYLDNAILNARRMKKLITDILEYSQKDSINFEQIDLNELLNSIFLNYWENPTYQPSKLTKSKLPIITGDTGLLTQLFTNLIENAIKYQPCGNTPEISIDAEESDSNWIIHVADNGIGINPDFQTKVFEMFKRLHYESEYSGSGIGLANCKRIVTAHGGKIWYEPNIPQGTVFKFTLPKY